MTPDKHSAAKLQPKWSLPHDERFPDKANSGPGPANYEIPSKIDEGPKFTTRVKPFVDPFKMKTDPGPGFYDPLKSEKKIQYSISKRHGPTFDKAANPGPGAYEDERTQHYASIPGSKMGRDVRKREFLKTPAHDKPAPGKYERPGFTEHETGVPKYGFGSSTRDRKNYGGPPGPGHYNHTA